MDKHGHEKFKVFMTGLLSTAKNLASY